MHRSAERSCLDWTRRIGLVTIFAVREPNRVSAIETEDPRYARPKLNLFLFFNPPALVQPYCMVHGRDQLL